MSGQSALTGSEKAPVLPDDIRLEGGLCLTCSNCGGVFEVAVWQPRLCCPHCGMIGYPDRAGFNLLSAGWECPSCGAPNNGMLPFCIACGAGLASRCLRCEAPVYSAMCPHCGAHQARLRRLQLTMSQRDSWRPVLIARLSQEQAHREGQPFHDPSYGVAGWQAIDQRAPEPAAQTDLGRLPRRTRIYTWGGWLLMAGGAAWLWFGPVGAKLREKAAAGKLGPWRETFQLWLDEAVGLAGSIWLWIKSQWDYLAPIFTEMGQLQPDDPRYAYVFATATFGLALLPILLYAIARFVRRLFP